MSAQTDIEPVATTFRAIGTDHAILATDPDALEPAVRLAQQHLADLDLAASRFRSDSEVSGLARAARSGPVTATVSPLLASYVQAALQTAQVTDGLVLQSVGRREAHLGAAMDGVPSMTLQIPLKTASASPVGTGISPSMPAAPAVQSPMIPQGVTPGLELPGIPNAPVNPVQGQ